MYLVALLFLPGTFLHEIAHYLTALLLRVPAGAITLWPRLIGNDAVFGSVKIAKSDPFRRFLIGIAPLLVGLISLMAVIHFGKDIELTPVYLKIVLLGFLIFEIANTMFSSDRDMEGSLALFLTIGILTATLVIVGIRFSFSFVLPQQAILFLQTGAFYLLFPLAIDSFFLILFSLLNRQR